MTTNLSRLCLYSLLVPVIAVFATPNSARSAKLKETVAKFSLDYTGTGDSNYVRVIINDLVKENVVQAKTTATLTITPEMGAAVNSTLKIDPLRMASFQPKIGNNTAKPGFIDFIAKKNEIKAPADGSTTTVTVTVVFDGNVEGKFKPANAVFRDGDGGVGVNVARASGKVSGFTSKFDPEYTAINDMELPSLSSDAPFEIRNLVFFGNVPESFINSIDLQTVAADEFDPSLPNFTMSSSQMESAPNPSSFLFTNPFPEPLPDLYDGAYGQLYDPSTGNVSGFLHAFQAAPEPGTLMLLTIAGAAHLAFRRRVRTLSPLG